jgi:hypothetical protein
VIDITDAESIHQHAILIVVVVILAIGAVCVIAKVADMTGPDE